MQGSWMLSKTRVVCGHSSKVVGVTNLGNFENTYQKSQSQIFTFPTSARRSDTVHSFYNEISEDGDINGSRFSLREIFEELKRCAQSRGSAISVSPPQFGPSWQCGRTEFRSWFSTGNQESSRLQEFGESPGDPNQGESDEAGSRTVGRGESRKIEKGDEGLRRVERKREKTSQLRVEKTSSESEGGLGFGSEEYWGNVHKKAVSENLVLKMSKAVRASGDGELSACGEANLRVLLALGANEQQVMTVFRKHPKLHAVLVSSPLLESARLFHDFGINAQALLRVIVKFSQRGRSTMLRSSATDGNKQVLAFLSDEIGEKDLAKVVTKQPTLLSYSIQALRERESTLKSLGIAVDGAFVENFPSVLLGNPELLRKKAQVLDLALGSGIYVKQPMLFGINAKNVAKRVANLKVVVGEALSVEELLVKKPNILIASEETAREMWLKLVNVFGKDDVVRSIRGLHHILGRNWKGLHPKLDYLKSNSGEDSVEGICLLVCPISHSQVWT